MSQVTPYLLLLSISNIGSSFCLSLHLCFVYLTPLHSGIAGRLSEVGRIMSRDQLQILESSGTRKASVSPSPSMRGPQADLNLTASEDQTDTSRLSLEPGEVSPDLLLLLLLLLLSSLLLSDEERPGDVSRQPRDGQLSPR